MTTRVEGDTDQGLLKEKGGRGFPTLLFLDQDGEILAQQGDRSVDGFRKTAAALTEVAALAAKTDRTAEEEVRYFLARVDLGQLGLQEAKRLAAALPSAPTALGEQVAAALFRLEIDDALESVRDEDGAKAVGKRFAEMLEAGRTPPAQGMSSARFWLLVAQHAKAESSVELFEKAFAGLKQTLGDGESYQRLYEQMQADLDKLKG